MASGRRGIGRGLYASLFAILARQRYVNAYAGITLPNPASVGLHEAAGGQLEDELLAVGEVDAAGESAREVDRGGAAVSIGRVAEGDIGDTAV